MSGPGKGSPGVPRGASDEPVRAAGPIGSAWEKAQYERETPLGRKELAALVTNSSPLRAPVTGLPVQHYAGDIWLGTPEPLETFDAGETVVVRALDGDKFAIVAHGPLSRPYRVNARALLQAQTGRTA